MKNTSVLILTLLFVWAGCSSAQEDADQTATPSGDQVNNTGNLGETTSSQTIDRIGPARANTNCDPTPQPALHECEYLNVFDHIVEATVEFIEPRTTPMFSQTGELIQGCDGHISENMYIRLKDVTALKGEPVDAVWVHRNVFDNAHSYPSLSNEGEVNWTGEELFRPGQRVILPVHELVPGRYMIGLLAYFDVVDGALIGHAGKLETCQMWTPESVKTADWFHTLPTDCDGVAPAAGMTSQSQSGTINLANTLPVCQPKEDNSTRR